MKVAVTAVNGMIFEHFGKCPLFTIYTIEDKAIVDQSVLNAQGSGHSALVDLLKEHDINLLICGGIGQGAKDALSAKQIDVICGVTGSVEHAIYQYLNGSLIGVPDFVCSHHHEGSHDDHNCHCHS